MIGTSALRMVVRLSLEGLLITPLVLFRLAFISQGTLKNHNCKFKVSIEEHVLDTNAGMQLS